eukprot:gnl/TRDRNA2_/TRDRNA2_176081_c0_seq1.p1 gnl/TRDRNA2_/TRDRNA2_176081_c0~~gnl/TRDRNA2_/TRDRNA2_176081_c0_seq1.p1  ORF type:complete len:596 (-),score=34.57 gnl/TRDRNA2_/TRDRNA2_176081_c0_seq1:150-1907(-)
MSFAVPKTHIKLLSVGAILLLEALASGLRLSAHAPHRLVSPTDVVERCQHFLRANSEMINRAESSGDTRVTSSPIDAQLCSRAKVMQRLRDTYGVVLMPFIKDYIVAAGNLVVPLYNCLKTQTSLPTNATHGSLNIWARLVGAAIVAAHVVDIRNNTVGQENGLVPDYELHFRVFDQGSYKLELQYRAWFDFNHTSKSTATFPPSIDYFGFPVDLHTQSVKYHGGQCMWGNPSGWLERITSYPQKHKCFEPPYDQEVISVKGNLDNEGNQRQCSIQESTRAGRWVLRSLNCPQDPRCEISTNVAIHNQSTLRHSSLHNMFWIWKTEGCEWYVPSQDRLQKYLRRFSSWIVHGSSMTRQQLEAVHMFDNRVFNHIVNRSIRIETNVTYKGRPSMHTETGPLPRIIWADTNLPHNLVWSGCQPSIAVEHAKSFLATYQQSRRDGDVAIFYRMHYINECGFSRNSCEPMASYGTRKVAEQMQMNGFMVFDANRITKAMPEQQVEGLHAKDALLKHMCLMMLGAMVAGPSPPSMPAASQSQVDKLPKGVEQSSFTSTSSPPEAAWPDALPMDSSDERAWSDGPLCRCCF